MRVRALPDAFEIHFADGSTRRLAEGDARLYFAGANGKTLYVEDDALTLVVSDWAFVQQLAAADDGRSARRVKALLATRKQAQGRRYWRLAGLLVVVAALLAAALYGVMQALESSVELVPPKVDQQLGELSFSQMKPSLPRWEQPEAEHFVQSAIEALAHAQGETPWTFHMRVVDEPTVNAFALPGGNMVVYRGLLQQAESPGEVIGVLAHEITHVTERHGMKRLVRAVGIVGAIQLVLGDVAGLVALGRELLTVSAINAYSRDQEESADAGAARLMAELGFEARALARFFARLNEDQGATPEMLKWLSTHPDPVARSRELKALAERFPKQPAAQRAALTQAWEAYVATRKPS